MRESNQFRAEIARFDDARETQPAPADEKYPVGAVISFSEYKKHDDGDELWEWVDYEKNVRRVR
jgi:hypothetical protein